MADTNDGMGATVGPVNTLSAVQDGSNKDGVVNNNSLTVHSKVSKCPHNGKGCAKKFKYGYNPGNPSADGTAGQSSTIKLANGREITLAYTPYGHGRPGDFVPAPPQEQYPVYEPPVRKIGKQSKRKGRGNADKKKPKKSKKSTDHAVPGSKTEAARKGFEEEVMESVQQRFRPIIDDILAKQREYFKQKRDLDQKMIEFQREKERVNIRADFLVAGQAQLQYELERRGFKIDHTLLHHAKLQGINEGLSARSAETIELQAMAANFEAREMRIEHRERLLDMGAAAVLEDKIRAQVKKELGKTLCREAYENGMTAGMFTGREQGHVAGHEQGFREGYAAAVKDKLLLDGLKSGTIDPKQPEVQHLFDLTHPKNPYTLSLEVGRPDHGPAPIISSSQDDNSNADSSSSDSTNRLGDRVSDSSLSDDDTVALSEEEVRPNVPVHDLISLE